MKKLLIFMTVALLILSAFISKTKLITSIYGTIEPAEGAGKVWAVSGKDSVAVIPQAGKFSVAVGKAGTYKIFIQAIRPFKDAVVDNIKVEDGKSADAGIITLSK